MMDSTFEVILKPKTKISKKAQQLLDNSKQYKEAGLIRAGQKLELEAAFEVCNLLHIPIYRKDNNWVTSEQIYSGMELKKRGYGHGQNLKSDADYKSYYKYIFSMEFYLLEKYPDIVPQDVIERLQKINKKYYPSLYIIDLTTREPSAGSIPISQMTNIDSHALVFVQPYKKSKLDPILLYKFDYGEYYMELARWD